MSILQEHRPIYVLHKSPYMRYHQACRVCNLSAISEQYMLRPKACCILNKFKYFLIQKLWSVSWILVACKRMNVHDFLICFQYESNTVFIVARIDRGDFVCIWKKKARTSHTPLIHYDKDNERYATHIASHCSYNVFIMDTQTLAADELCIGILVVFVHPFWVVFFERI